MILEIHLLPAVQHMYRTYNHPLAQISQDTWIPSMYGTILHRTIILRTVLYLGKKTLPHEKQYFLFISNPIF